MELFKFASIVTVTILLSATPMNAKAGAISEIVKKGITAIAKRPVAKAVPRAHPNVKAAETTTAAKSSHRTTGDEVKEAADVAVEGANKYLEGSAERCKTMKERNPKADCK